MTAWLMLAVIFVTLAILGIGLFAVAMIVVASIRNKRQWAGESLTLTAEQAAGLEDPAAGGSTDGADTNTTDAWAIAQVQSRVTGISGGAGAAGGL